MFAGRWVLAVLVACVALSGRLPADDKKKPDDQAREVVENLIKALQAKDLDAVMKMVDVPFCESGKRNIPDRDDLKKLWARAIKDKDIGDRKFEIKQVATLEKLEEEAGKKLKEERRKLLVEVLGKEHRLVVLEISGTDRKTAIAVRLDGGKPVIVGVLV